MIFKIKQLTGALEQWQPQHRSYNFAFSSVVVILFFQRCEEMERMDRELNELTNERNALLGQNTSLEGQLTELREEIR
jgi:hypothetical protein